MILLRQRNFARRDYAGLDEKAKASLLEDRRALAEELLNKRKKILHQAAQKEHDYNKALDFIKGHEWASDGWHKDLEKLPEGVRKQVSEISVNNTAAENNALNGWKERYNKVLGQSKDDAKFDRQSALKDTERRAKLTENVRQPQTPKSNPTAPNPNPASTKPQTPNKPAASSPAGQKSSGFLSKNMQRAGRLFKGTSKYGKAGQIAAIGTTALAAGGLGYGVYRTAKNKNDKNK